MRRKPVAGLLDVAAGTDGSVLGRGQGQSEHRRIPDRPLHRRQRHPHLAVVERRSDRRFGRARRASRGRLTTRESSSPDSRHRPDRYTEGGATLDRRLASATRPPTSGSGQGPCCTPGPPPTRHLRVGTARQPSQPQPGSAGRSWTGRPGRAVPSASPPGPTVSRGWSTRLAPLASGGRDGCHGRVHDLRRRKVTGTALAAGGHCSRASQCRSTAPPTSQGHRRQQRCLRVLDRPRPLAHPGRVLPAVHRRSRPVGIGSGSMYIYIEDEGRFTEYKRFLPQQAPQMLTSTTTA